MARFAHLSALFGRQNRQIWVKKPKMPYFEVFGSVPGRSELSSACTMGPYWVICEGLGPPLTHIWVPGLSPGIFPAHSAPYGKNPKVARKSHRTSAKFAGTKFRLLQKCILLVCRRNKFRPHIYVRGLSPFARFLGGILANAKMPPGTKVPILFDCACMLARQACTRAPNSISGHRAKARAPQNYSLSGKGQFPWL